MKSSDAKSVIVAMVEALNKHVIEGQETDWAANAKWHILSRR
jgi:hypothetical protein